MWTAAAGRPGFPAGKAEKAELVPVRGGALANAGCLCVPALYGPVEMLAIGGDEGAGFELPAPFAVEKPVLFYATSITQGRNASRPGLSYQAMLARDLNLD